jgi:hypothetical protein
MRNPLVLALTAPLLAASLLLTAAQVRPAPDSGAGHLPLTVFYDLMADDRTAGAALDRIDAGWRDGYAGMLLDLVYFVVSDPIEDRMTRLLEQASGISYRGDYDPFYRWLWTAKPAEHPDYADFKAQLYADIDPRFRAYFDGDPARTIRLDEVLWGGVRRDGIPPLVDPGMIPARDAGYLGDDNIVFGVYLNGEARAYPKRILAWHELVRDRVGGREIAGVYCTLCGAMIVYDPEVRGTRHVLGTSGFLYRSNKLMYDQATESLWSTFTGEPVVGPLVDKGIELRTLPVVTASWKEWRARHPDTLALSLDTGRDRDYGEGAAYRDYFATDRLMFTVPGIDRRLPNKAEVLALRYGGEPLAISAEYLKRRPVHHDRTGGTGFVVLTDASGANRVYETNGVRFTAWDGATRAFDTGGDGWAVSESALTHSDGRRLERLTAHRAFWFGWQAQFPETRLVK